MSWSVEVAGVHAEGHPRCDVDGGYWLRYSTTHRTLGTVRFIGGKRARSWAWCCWPNTLVGDFATTRKAAGEAVLTWYVEHDPATLNAPLVFGTSYDYR